MQVHSKRKAQAAKKGGKGKRGQKSIPGRGKKRRP